MQDTGANEAAAFGQMIRERRRALGLRQEDVVLATGVGRRYLIELESGKPTARIGPALMIARHLGIVLGLAQPAGAAGQPGPMPQLPPLED